MGLSIAAFVIPDLKHCSFFVRQARASQQRFLDLAVEQSPRASPAAPANPRSSRLNTRTARSESEIPPLDLVGQSFAVFIRQRCTQGLTLHTVMGRMDLLYAFPNPRTD